MLRIQMIQAKGILKVIEEGEVDLARAKDSLQQIAAAAPAQQDFVILVDARERISKLSTTDLWFIAEALAEYGTTFRRRTALLVKLEDMEKAKLLELFATNRGFLVNAFSSYEDGLNWLMTPNEAAKAPVEEAA